MKRDIVPVTHLEAEVSVPGSKSLTQRAMVIAALAEGSTTLYEPLLAEDTLLLASALKEVGADIIVEEKAIHLKPIERIQSPFHPLYFGNNGTGIRLMTALVALGQGKFVLTGNERLCERPMAPLIYALQSLGVKALSREGKGTPPTEIEARGVEGGKVTLTDIESSQYVSALLIAAPHMLKGLELELKGRIPSQPYIEMTMEIMREFGVEVEAEFPRLFRVNPGQRYVGRTYTVEGDASSASYFFLAAAVTGGKIRVVNVNPKSGQGDMRICQILEELGIEVNLHAKGVEVIGKPTARGFFSFDLKDIPDMVPTIAILAAVREGVTEIMNVSHLRYKESNRLYALARELNRVGIRVEEKEDGLIIHGGNPHGAEIETYGDHRIAMSFACLGLTVPGITILGSECVGKSFPSFWERFEKLEKSGKA